MLQCKFGHCMSGSSSHDLKKPFYLFIYLFRLCWVFVDVGFSLVVSFSLLCDEQRGAILYCGPQASHCSGFSCGAFQSGSRVCRLQQLWHMTSVVVARRLQSTGSVAVAHGLSCSVASGLFLDQGSNPCLLHCQADSLPLSHQGNPHMHS